MSRSMLPLLATAIFLTGCSKAADSGAPQPASETTTTTAERQWQGKWAVSLSGQPYLTPENPKGEPVTTKFRKGDEMNTCNEDGPVRASRVVPQWVNGRYLLFSEEDGPTKVLDNGAPVGYARTPAGAALAAYNAVSILSPLDYFSSETLATLWDFGRPLGGELKPGEHYLENSPGLVSIPYAFRTTSCTSRSAEVSLLVDIDTPEAYGIVTLPVVFEDGVWIVRTTPDRFQQNATQISTDDIEWTQWTKWDFG